MGTSMHIKLKDFVLVERDITWVRILRTIGTTGFNFEGTAPEEHGRSIVSVLREMERNPGFEFEVVDIQSDLLTGWGKFESLGIKEPGKDDVAPLMYKYWGAVSKVQ